MGDVEREYRIGLDQQRELHLDEDASENVKHFYERHIEICEKAFDYYIKFDEEMPKFVREPVIMEVCEFRKLLKEVTVLVITSNPIEMGVFLHWLSDTAKSTIDSYLVGSNTYTVVSLNDGQTIVHHHAGDTGEELVRITMERVLKVFEPTYVILLGICYGLYMKTQKIGAILISDKVIGFRINFREQDDGTTLNEVQDEIEDKPQREFIQKVKNRLIFTSVASILSDEKKPTISRHQIGPILSCNSLMSSHAVKEDILSQFKPRRVKPVAGEMEGSGLLRSTYVSDEGFGRWLVIKSICDWGEKKNQLDTDEMKSEHIKDSIQAFAMSNSCAMFDKLLSIFDGK